MISKEQDFIDDPFTINSNLMSRKDRKQVEITRYEAHLMSQAIANYPQATEFLDLLKAELSFMETLIQVFQKRIPR